jgi:SulP family sulfate permease
MAGAIHCGSRPPLQSMAEAKHVKEMISAMPEPPRALIFDAVSQDEIDVTSSEIVEGLLRQLRSNNIEVYFADVHKPVLEYARATGLLESIGEDHVFPTVVAAVEHFEGKA